MSLFVTRLSHVIPYHPIHHSVHPFVLLVKVVLSVRTLNRERLLFDLRRTLGLVLDSLRTRLIRVCCFALRTPALQLPVRVGTALHAAMFQLAVRAWVAYRAAIFPLAVRAGVAPHALAF